MYNAKFITTKGQKINLGLEYGVAFDITKLSGIPVNLSLSNAFAEVGNNVILQSVGGASLAVRGVIFQDIVETKNALRKIFAPFMQGDLWINDEYFIKVYVKSSPTFNPKKDDGRFSLELFAPNPFFRRSATLNVSNNIITKDFSFPVNYSTPHRFGTILKSTQILITNSGDVSTPFELHVTTSTSVENLRIEDYSTGKFLQFIGVINSSDELIMDRDEQGFLRMQRKAYGVYEDAFNMLDDTSTLYELPIGDIALGVSGDGVTIADANVTITFYEMVGAVYEN